VSRWEQGLVVPFPFYRRRLCALFDKTAEELGLPSDGDDALPAVGQGSLSSGQERDNENVPSLAHAISIPNNLSPSLSETPPEPAEALPQAAEMSTLPEAVTFTQPPQSPGKSWRIVLFVAAIAVLVSYITTMYLTPQIISSSTSAVFHTEAVDDSIQGTGLDQFTYVGNNWGHCTGGCHGRHPPGAYDLSNSWDNTINDYVTITFHGIQIKFYGVVGPPHGIGAISIDGRPETMVDFYSPTQAGDTLLYTSPVLALDQHTLKVRVTGQKNSHATWNGINPDRVDILS
jgi:hypothetical protein